MPKYNQLSDYQRAMLKRRNEIIIAPKYKTTTPEEKQKIIDEMENKIEEFFLNGGEIKKIPIGVTGYDLPKSILRKGKTSSSIL